MLYKRHKAR